VTANSTADGVSVLLNRGDGGFRSRVDYKAKANDLPYEVAIGDLNGDGAPDLATANLIGSVSLLANRGDGTFSTHVDLDACGLSVAIGDVNRDGLPDLATGCGHFVAVLMNRGGRSFSFTDGVSYQTGNYPASIAIEDLNGDARPDLATANRGDDTISLLFNRGDGTFWPKRDYGVGIGPGSIAIGDLNRDGSLELAAANFSTRDVSVLLNRGGGSFGLARDYPVEGDAVAVAIGDLNDDGRPDLAVVDAGDRTSAVSVLANRGDGRFGRGLEFATARNPLAVASGDLNGDGRSDLVSANRSNSVSVLVNRPGLCIVQELKGRRLTIAKRMLARANCRVGSVRRLHSARITRGRVVSQRPRFGAVLRGGGKVDLVVSHGRPS
jgi:FG-GAP-like repeat/PASTA domain